MMRRTGRQLLASILVNSIYEMKNYPVVLLNTVLAPLSFLTLIWFVSQGTLLGPAIIGGLIMTMFSSGTSLQADLSHLKNDFKLQDMVVSSPTSASTYVIGIAISELIYYLPAILILSALFYLFVPVTILQLAGIIVVLSFVFVTSVSLGFALATLSSDIVQSFAFTRLLTTLFSTLAPVYYPITYIPLPYRYLAYLSPTTYAAQIAQNLSGLLVSSTNELIVDWAVLITLTAVFLWIGVSKSRWREK
jgi:ABC-2 type transport system permease protein